MSAATGAGGTVEIAPEVVDEVRERLAREPGGLTPHRVSEALRVAGRPVGDATVLAVYEALRRDVVGAGPLEPLLRLPGVTDVLVNGPDQVFVDRGEGLEVTGVRFPDDDGVRRLAQRLAAAGGRRLDDASPYADLRLADGTRFHAVLAPLARPGTAISLRVPSARVFTLAELVESGMVAPALGELLRGIVDARLAFLVSGGTGSGKTTHWLRHVYVRHWTPTGLRGARHEHQNTQEAAVRDPARPDLGRPRRRPERRRSGL
ncbi:ATPase, T2SS/T4P/T4SS family [Nocardioides cheoyonin]|uniref:ATPase, T2SS/T4P/T4SS family n=1 Tax=Nocardioides cheoyonin TaxID=3156615 RepID=UPI0032B5499F